MEQARIKQIIKFVISQNQSGNKGNNELQVLDFGAGTGNLTKYFLDYGLHVTSADISEGCLEVLRSKFDKNERLDTILINGKDLKIIPNDCYDIVATYSVLHHVPDYLCILDELVRVLKPGGVLYIDHEVSPGYWEFNKEYMEYLSELGEEFLCHHSLELGLEYKLKTNLKKIFIKFNGVLKKIIKTIIFKHVIHQKNDQEREIAADEGDIHVRKNDHIEWEKVKAQLNKSCDIIKEEDYLVCRELANYVKTWEKWHDKCYDMHLLIALKKSHTEGI